MATTKESQTYKHMLDEVEALTRDIGQTDIDLDTLVTKVERGYSLIQTMRERLEETKAKVEELHDRFEPLQGHSVVE